MEAVTASQAGAEETGWRRVERAGWKVQRRKAEGTTETTASGARAVDMRCGPCAGLRAVEPIRCLFLDRRLECFVWIMWVVCNCCTVGTPSQERPALYYTIVEWCSVV